ncbi:hypothetical protein PC111_g2564 [Phytophthora cactorum]|nr:hypothetical protein PC111_g2564 [Phytophthora cactorum]
MSIWMEDQSSKKQWFKDGMVKDDYVSTANAIPDASAADYVECFRDTLDSDLVDSSDAMRKLYALKGGALRLELAVTIRVLRSTCVISNMSSKNFRGELKSDYQRKKMKYSTVTGTESIASYTFFSKLIVLQHELLHLQLDLTPTNTVATLRKKTLLQFSLKTTEFLMHTLLLHSRVGAGSTSVANKSKSSAYIVHSLLPLVLGLHGRVSKAVDVDIDEMALRDNARN